jgi:hypothetical protein
LHPINIDTAGQMHFSPATVATINQIIQQRGHLLDPVELQTLQAAAGNDLFRTFQYRANGLEVAGNYHAVAGIRIADLDRSSGYVPVLAASHEYLRNYHAGNRGMALLRLGQVGVESFVVAYTALKAPAAAGVGGGAQALDRAARRPTKQGANTLPPGNSEQRATAHGAERLADPTRHLTPVEEAATRVCHTLRANNGATVYIHQAEPGKFNVIIEGQGGFMTRYRHLRIEDVRRMAIKYEWTAP